MSRRIRQEEADGLIESDAPDFDEEGDGVSGYGGGGLRPVMLLDDDLRGCTGDDVVPVSEGLKPVAEVLKDGPEGVWGAWRISAFVQGLPPSSRRKRWCEKSACVE